MIYQSTSKFTPVRFLSAAAIAMAWSGGALADSREKVSGACEAANAAHHNALVSIPFEIVHGRVYIDAAVNGLGPFTFAVDTGASGIGRADASLTNALNLPFASKAETSDGVAVSEVDTVQIESLEVGGLVRTDLELISRDYSGSAPDGAEISGIVGRDFFGDGLLVIDFTNLTLTFTQSTGLPSGNEGAIAYERPYRIPVSIGGVTMEANLDTGAGVGLVLPKILYDQVSNAPLESAGTARLTNTTIETSNGIVPGPVIIGDTMTRNADARVSDRFPEAVIGAHILQSYVIAIDQRSQLVAVCSGD